ncbi:GH36-type glycosyl hydrolase domain-containing protein [Enterococcus massiliensis]|uniref:GH36-type glycosyl hydrolase domain-containing protein n=1 Tax=Enterococcus massiliensis TaxID=1640685 RepID=UPI00065DCD4A|nr:cellobiose phosphorylase [Enterococcus massiliensis]
MKQKQYIQNGVRATFLPTGDLYEITKNDIMINQLNGNPLDGSCNQLYLRVFENDTIFSTPLIGSNSESTVSFQKDGILWQGEYRGITYYVSFALSEAGIWFWTVELIGDGKVVDVISGQDLGNASKGAVQSNEAYMSQYVDHKVMHNENGYIVTSRQNQPQDGLFPVVELGSLSKTVGFSTDGYQFFGRSYKKTNKPEALVKESLENEVYQYEFAYIALQSEKAELTNNEKREIIFYGGTKENLSTSVEVPIFNSSLVQAIYQKLTPLEKDKTGISFSKKIGKTLIGETFSDQEIETLFPIRTLVEKSSSNQLLSFFTEKYRHVVLQEKETAMERAHGHILLSGTDLTVDKPPLSTTLYMYGIFNSQIVLGNTSMNKLMSNSRNSLNVFKQSGQRIYLKREDDWVLLTMPSAFEMGLNEATWYYKLTDDLIKITTYTLADSREVRTVFSSEKKKEYTLAISNHLLMNDAEIPKYLVKKEDHSLKITAATDSVIHTEYPNLVYYLNLNKDFQVTDERIFGVQTDDPNLQILLPVPTAEFTMTIQGSLTGEKFVHTATTQVAEETKFSSFIDGLLNNFQLKHDDAEVESTNVLARWYTHNMLVHYLSPHGLEQYGGAAWGTRDVSQGPTEFFFAVNRPEIVGSIIKTIYANQFDNDGNWPQWFMFDRYETVKADESHGDVIVWPMKVVADYLEKTEDFELLKVSIPFTDRKTFKKTKDQYSLFEHLKKEIAYIEKNFLEETYLSCYGDGDWDDTLQPYDNKLKKHMASSWTVALTYQVINKLSIVLKNEEPEFATHLSQLKDGIKADFEKYMLGNDTIPGFVYMEKKDQPEMMIHPTDKKTGIQYRLLPMTRSMIAELLTPEQVAAHLAIIKKYLQFPDGVRLMNRPAHYHGGVSTNFKRAEQAANFGREIGLQYVHAHIRFTEAMAKIGEAEETWKALQTINPIQITKRVPHAELRQSNVYFSSSDGDFKTRYEAQENFDKLRQGQVGVKGGWRIYSSGPGIYMNQLLTSVLGIRETTKHVTFDPILPKELNGLTMDYKLLKKNVEIVFHNDHLEKKIVINGTSVEYTVNENPYREGGLTVNVTDMEQLLKDTNTIEIFY